MSEDKKVSILRDYLNCFKDDKGDKAQVGVLNCLNIIDYAHNGDMSNEDFSNLDLRRCSFSWRSFNNTKLMKSYISRSLFFPQGHTEKVRNASYSPCGNFIISSSNRELILWESHTGKVLYKHLNKKGFIENAIYSPCGEHIISIIEFWKNEDLLYNDSYSNYDYTSIEKRCREFNVIISSNVKLHPLYRNLSPCLRYSVFSLSDDMIGILNRESCEVKDIRISKGDRSIDYSTCGEFLFIIYEDKSELRNIKTGNVIFSLKNDAHKPVHGNCSKDGGFIACHFVDLRTHYVKVFNCKTNELVCTITEPSVHFGSFSFSSCSNFIVSTSNTTVKLHCSKTGKLIQSMEGAAGGATNAQFSPRGNFILCTFAGTIKIWKLINKDYVLMLTLKNRSEYIENAVFSPCEKYIVSSSDKNILIWNSETGKCIKKIRTQGYERNVSYSPCGNYIISVSGNRIIVRLSETGDYPCFKPIINTEKYLLISASYNPKSDKSEIIVTTTNRKIQIWNIKTGELLLDIKKESLSQEPLLRSSRGAIFSPCAKFILLYDYELTQVLCSKTGAPVSPNVGFSQISPKYSPEGNYIVVGGSDGQLEVLCANSYNLICVIKDVYNINCASFSACENYIISSFDDSSLKIHRCTTGDLIKEIFPMVTQVLAMDIGKVISGGLAEREQLTIDDFLALKQNGAVID